jgi:hypothetical protein
MDIRPLTTEKKNFITLLVPSLLLMVRLLQAISTLGADKLYYVAKFLPNQIIARRFQDFNITVTNKTTVDPRSRYMILGEGDGDNDGSGNIEIPQPTAADNSTRFPDYVQEHFQMTYNQK